MESIEFKIAEIDDWQEVAELEKGSDSPFFQPCIGEKGYKKYLNESTVYFIVIDDKKIGTISYKETGDRILIINGLTVLPEYRGCGIAKNAMEKLIDEIGNNTLTLYVHPKNTPALLIYLKLGFEISEWKDNVFGNGEPRLFLIKKP